jgi:hypothetical protein
MSHAQKPDFVFRRNGRVHLNRQGLQFSRLLAAEVCASAVVMLDTPSSEVVWRVLATHSIRQFPPSLPLPRVTVCHHFSTGLYYRVNLCRVLSANSVKAWWLPVLSYTYSRVGQQATMRTRPPWIYLHCVCFHLYCSCFILFCNVCVCVCVWGGCNVWVF